MSKKSKYTDTAFLSLFALFIIVSVVAHFKNGYVLSINNYVAFISLLIVGYNFFISDKKWKYSVPVLLLLSTFNIINFYVAIINSSVYHINDRLIFNWPGFNIVAFIFLIVYSFTNSDSAIKFFRIIFKGSDSEQEEKRNKMIDFYYNKFNGLEGNDFENVLKNLTDYPTEGQIAIKKIIAER